MARGGFSAIQRTIFAMGLLAMAASGLYVPWYVSIQQGSNAIVIERGYSFLHSLPDGIGVEVDYAQILLRWAVIAAFTGAAFLLVGLLHRGNRRKVD